MQLQVNQALSLPSANCKFMTPITSMDKNEFFSAWQVWAAAADTIQIAKAVLQWLWIVLAPSTIN